MERLSYIVTMLEQTLGTKNKRHIFGGTLISVSLLFGGLALTVMTLRNNNEEDNERNEFEAY